MLNDLFKKNRSEDDGKKADSQRSDRIYEDKGRWFFKTREGLNIGPFQKRREAQYALLYFTERAEWPTDQELAEFIEGCKLFDA